MSVARSPARAHGRWLSAALAACACHGDDSKSDACTPPCIAGEEAEAEAEAEGEGEGGEAAFEEATDKAGLPEGLPADCVIVQDLDRDGHEDIALIAAPGFTLYTMWGRGDLTFDTDTLDMGEIASSCLAVDLDGNGLRDLVFGPTPVRVLLQRTARSFVEQTPIQTAGGGFVRGMAAADFDRDGRLDLHLGVESSEFGERLACEVMPHDVQCHFAVNQPPDGTLCEDHAAACDLPPGGFDDLTEPTRDAILIQREGGRFEDLGSQLGMVDAPGNGLAAAAADFNRDGRPDLFVGNDWWENHVYLSDGARLRERAGAMGVSVYNHAMGLAVADFDGDGGWDVYVTDIGADQLYLGRGQGAEFAFEDAGVENGVCDITREHYGWGVAAQDLDNDADVDVFVGVTYQGRRGLPEEDRWVRKVLERAACPGRCVIRDEEDARDDDQGNDVLLNDGTGRFLPGPRVGSGHVPDQLLGATNPVAAGDLDGDGRMDLVDGRPASLRPRLFRNVSPGAGHWLRLDLRGAGRNPDAIGAEVEVVAGGRTQIRQVAAYSAGGNGSLAVHVGLGAATEADVTVRWPGGAESEHRFGPGEIDRSHEIAQP